ncbi:hypothetical protein OHA25_44450 [Nonomuraea sp. NBC_00507]
MTLFDEAELEQQVGGLEPHVGFEAGDAAQGHAPAAGSRALGLHGPRPIRERAQRRRGALPLLRHLFGQGKVKGVVEQVFQLDDRRPGVGTARVLLGNDQVEFARLEGGQGCFRRHLRHVHPQARVQIAQQAQRRRHQSEGSRLKGGDAQRAGQISQRGRDLRLGLFQPLQHRFGVRDEDLGLLGQPHPPAHRLQQRNTDLRLQLRELLGHGRRAVGQGGGDGGEGATVLELA